jgi:hypothetical protein
MTGGEYKNCDGGGSEQLEGDMGRVNLWDFFPQPHYIFLCDLFYNAVSI